MNIKKAGDSKAEAKRVMPGISVSENLARSSPAGSVNRMANVEHQPLLNSLVHNGLPAMAGAFAAAATAGLAAGPALGIGAAAGLGFVWLNSHNKPS